MGGVGWREKRKARERQGREEGRKSVSYSGNVREKKERNKK